MGKALVHNGLRFSGAEGLLFRGTDNETRTRGHTQESSPGIGSVCKMNPRIESSKSGSETLVSPSCFHNRVQISPVVDSPVYRTVLHRAVDGEFARFPDIPVARNRANVAFEVGRLRVIARETILHNSKPQTHRPD